MIRRKDCDEIGARPDGRAVHVREYPALTPRLERDQSWRDWRPLCMAFASLWEWTWCRSAPFRWTKGLCQRTRRGRWKYYICRWIAERTWGANTSMSHCYNLQRDSIDESELSAVEGSDSYNSAQGECQQIGQRSKFRVGVWLRTHVITCD